MRQLPSQLRDKPFTSNQAAKFGVSRYALRKLVSLEKVELVVRGVYRASKDDLSEEDQYRVATLRVGSPSAICLVSALSYYGLTDIIPRKTWIMVPVSKRTKYPDLKLLRTRRSQWHIGIKNQDGYSITTLERTIVDSLCARTRIGTQVTIEALRKAVASKKTTLGKIMDVAKQLGVIHRIKSYVEALS